MGTATRVLRFSNLFRRFMSESVFDRVKLEKVLNSKKKKSEVKKILDFSNTSIEPFLNIEKLGLLEQYYLTNDLFPRDNSFLIIEDIARDIVKNVLNNNDGQKQLIVEKDPGLGLITINLIKSGVSKVLYYNMTPVEEVVLSQLKEHNDYVNKIIQKALFTAFQSTAELIVDAFNESKQYRVPLTLIVTCLDFSFIKRLLMVLLTYKLYRDKFNIFVIISTPVLNVLKGKEYKTNFRLFHQFLFQHFIKIDELAKYPRNAFLPINEVDTQDMNLIRISLRSDFSELLKEDDLSDYRDFLAILCMKKDSFIIPTLEKWLCGCGPYLISKGVSMTLQVQDLSHEESLLLFSFFQKCDGYQEYKELAKNLLSVNLSGLMC